MITFKLSISRASLADLVIERCTMTMRTWDDYKKHVKVISPKDKKNIEKIEDLAAIIGAVVENGIQWVFSKENLLPFVEFFSLPLLELSLSRLRQKLRP